MPSSKTASLSLQALNTEESGFLLSTEMTPLLEHKEGIQDAWLHHQKKILQHSFRGLSAGVGKLWCVLVNKLYYGTGSRVCLSTIRVNGRAETEAQWLKA